MPGSLLAMGGLLAYRADVESETTPEETSGEPDRPVSARRPPGPRSGTPGSEIPDAPAEARAGEPRITRASRTADTDTHTADTHTAEIRPADTRSTPSRSTESGPKGAPETSARGAATGDARSAEVRIPDARTGDARIDGLRGGGSRGVDPRSDFRVVDARPAAAEPTVPTNIYRARRPAVAIVLIIPALAVGFLLVRALAVAAFGKEFFIGGVMASSLGLASLPLLVAGLYGLMTGAAHGAEQWGFRVWAKPPLAYLVVGIAFVLGAGLAIK
jgi:hypothetical protein